jgi:hypothetical protein
MPKSVAQMVSTSIELPSSPSGRRENSAQNAAFIVSGRPRRNAKYAMARPPTA